MSVMARFLSALCCAAVAIFFMKALGVPWWLYGPNYGDQADAGLFTFMAVICLTSPAGRRS